MTTTPRAPTPADTIKALRDALADERTWLEDQRKSISKGNGSSWDMMQCSERINLIDAALSLADASEDAPAVAAPAPAVQTMQRVFFPDGRASVSALQRTSRLSWDCALEFLQALNDEGWLAGLDISPHIEQSAARPAPVAATPAPGVMRDWDEDFTHENGQYENKCSGCGWVFIGHKRRSTCKACASPAAPVAEQAKPEPVSMVCAQCGADRLKVACRGGFPCAMTATACTEPVERGQQAGAVDGWISVSDRLPEVGADVLCYWHPLNGSPQRGACFGAATYVKPKYWHCPEDEEDEFGAPLYWQPLPAAPIAASATHKEEGK